MATAVRPQFEVNYFFQQLVHKHKRVLILDYDTTLTRVAEIGSSRLPYPTIKDLLDCIASSARTRLVIASTRPARQVAKALGCSEAEVWGRDGRERLLPSVHSSRERLPLELLPADEAGMRRRLIDQLTAHYVVAYLVGLEQQPEQHSRLLISPELHVAGGGAGVGSPEPLVQFLADWLRACAGEVC